MLHGFGWSTAFLLVTRASTIAAVPIVLHSIGADLYAVWVLAGALVMIQSLFDLGVASALVRYVAQMAAAPEGARSAVIVVARRAMIFYIGLSAAVFFPVWFDARSLAELVHSLKPTEVGSAVVIVRWPVVALVLTDVTLVAASVLQGVDRVGASYRDQTIGWLSYLPLLIVGISVSSSAQAVGAAWVGAYTLQLLLLGRSLRSGLRSVRQGMVPVPRLREMFSFGARWQVSALADFATFQLPRFVAGFTLASGDVVELDVAIRAAQFVVAPLFAFYPTVLPRAASLLARGGAPALRNFLQPLYAVGLTLVVAGTCMAAPIEVPALAVWTGRSVDGFSPLVAALVLIGTAAHASTGLLTSARLARGEANPVLVYKGRQLLLALALLAIAGPIGLAAVATAMCVALLLPAMTFNRRAVRDLGLSGAVATTRIRVIVAALAAVQITVPTVLVITVGSAIPSWQLLGLVGAAALACLACEGSLLIGSNRARLYWSDVRTADAITGKPPMADHFSRK